MDIVDRATRARMMSGIHDKDTKPEMLIRKRLHRQGFRFRVHVRTLSGKPDLVLPRYRAVIFVHGCFWHGHECPLFKWPQTRVEFWREKINRNRANDKRVVAALLADSWRVCVVWECTLRQNTDAIGSLIVQIADWLRGSDPYFEQ